MGITLQLLLHIKRKVWMAKENTNEQDSLLIIRWKYFLMHPAKFLIMKHSKHADHLCSAYVHVHTHTRTHTHPYTPSWWPPEVTAIWKMPCTLPEHEHEQLLKLPTRTRTFWGFILTEHINPHIYSFYPWIVIVMIMIFSALCQSGCVFSICVYCLS